MTDLNGEQVRVEAFLFQIAQSSYNFLSNISWLYSTGDAFCGVMSSSRVASSSSTSTTSGHAEVIRILSGMVAS